MLKGSRKPLEKRLKYTVNTVTGCHEFSGCKDRDGYGRLRNNDGFEFAHRASYRFHNGSIPKGLDILHTCDNPSCINQDHLYAGTHVQNMKDRSSRGRTKTKPRFGAENGRFGKPGTFLGKKHTEESKLKMSVAKKRRKLSL